MSLNEIMMSLELGLIYGIVAIGIYLTFRVIDFPDLTCDGSFVLGAASSGILVKLGYDPWFALLSTFVAGGAAGFVTGILNTCFKITNLLSGILVAFMLYSINLKVLGGVPNIALINRATVFNDNTIIILTLISIIIWLLCSYILVTDFGLALCSIGQNKRLALNNGVKVKSVTVIGLMISNGLISFGGGLFSQHQGFADISQGVGTVITGLAAVMIGERVFLGRAKWIAIFACLSGSIIYRFFVGVALHSEVLGLQTQDLNLITGLMVIGIMILPRTRRWRVIC